MAKSYAIKCVGRVNIFQEPACLRVQITCQSDWWFANRFMVLNMIFCKAIKGFRLLLLWSRLRSCFLRTNVLSSVWTADELTSVRVFWENWWLRLRRSKTRLIFNFNRQYLTKNLLHRAAFSAVYGAFLTAEINTCHDGIWGVNKFIMQSLERHLEQLSEKNSLRLSKAKVLVMQQNGPCERTHYTSSMELVLTCQCSRTLHILYAHRVSCVSAELFGTPAVR